MVNKTHSVRGRQASEDLGIHIEGKAERTLEASNGSKREKGRGL